MSKHGEIMMSEIRQTPEIFSKIIANDQISPQLANLISDSNIKSILVLARGTSDNAAHFQPAGRAILKGFVVHTLHHLDHAFA